MRRLRAAAMVALVVVAMAVLAPLVASADALGPAPHNCAGLTEKGHCMMQTGYGQVRLSSHYLHLGESVTATVTIIAKTCYQYNPCVTSIAWGVAGCPAKQFTCTFTLSQPIVDANRVGETTSGGNNYTTGPLGGGWEDFQVTIGGALGPATSSDYYAVLGAGVDLAAVGPHDLPAITTSLRAPNQVPLNPIDLGRSALLAAGLVFLVAFPGELFNSTLQAHYEEVMGWFGFLRRRRRPPPSSDPAFPATGEGGPDAAVVSQTETGVPKTPVWVIPLVMLFSALVASLIDPKFGFDLASLEAFIGALGAIAFTTFIYTGIGALLMRSTEKRWGWFRVYAGGFVVVLVCAAISRLTRAQPGYIYGVVLAYTLGHYAVPRKREGWHVAAGFAVILATSLLVWFAWPPIKQAAETSHAFPVVVLSALMASIFLGGMSSLVFGLVPLSFLPGEKLFGWRRIVWATLFSIGIFLFVHVVLNAAAGTPHPERNYLGAILLFLGFGAFSIAFWAYFRYRPTAVPSAVQA